MTSPCPTGCGRQVDLVRLVMCPDCWRRVPRDFQSEVWSAWRAVKQLATPEKIAAHRAAKQQAIDFVRSQAGRA
jgi:hypothetical protein